MKSKKLEVAVFSLMLASIVFTVLFFSFPKPLRAEMVCGVWYEPLPPTAHDFIYKSNCCIVIPPQH